MAQTYRGWHCSQAGWGGDWRQLAVDMLCNKSQGWVVKDEGAWQLEAQAAADAAGQLNCRQAVKAACADLTTCTLTTSVSGCLLTAEGQKRMSRLTSHICQHDQVLSLDGLLAEGVATAQADAALQLI